MAAPAKLKVDASWLLSDLDKPAFEAAETCYLTDVLSGNLQNWANRGLLSPARTKTGKGGARIYSKREIFVVKISQGLVRFGIEVSEAMYLAEKTLEVFFKYVDEIKDKRKRLEAPLHAAASVSRPAAGRLSIIFWHHIGKAILPDETADALLVNIGGHLKQVLDAYNYGREG